MNEQELKMLSRLVCWLDIPLISPMIHIIFDECLANGIKYNDEVLPLICAEANSVSRKLEE